MRCLDNPALDMPESDFWFNAALVYLLQAEAVRVEENNLKNSLEAVAWLAVLAGRLEDDAQQCWERHCRA